MSKKIIRPLSCDVNTCYMTSLFNALKSCARHMTQQKNEMLYECFFLIKSGCNGQDYMAKIWYLAMYPCNPMTSRHTASNSDDARSKRRLYPEGTMTDEYVVLAAGGALHKCCWWDTAQVLLLGHCSSAADGALLKCC